MLKFADLLRSEHQRSLLLSLVSHDPFEIILMCLIINVENCCVA